jgi:HSP20 family protein
MPEKRNETQQQRGLQRSQQQTRGLSRRDPFDDFVFAPFALMRRMQEDIDRMFGSFGRSRGFGLRGRESEGFDWAPAIEAFQRGNEFVVRAEVPGLSLEDLTVEIADDALTIGGERRYEQSEEREGVFHSERSYGSFCRVIALPDGAITESAQANFRDGVLEVVVQAPSRETRRGRRIEIGQEKGEQRTQQRSDQKTGQPAEQARSER